MQALSGPQIPPLHSAEGDTPSRGCSGTGRLPDLAPDPVPLPRPPVQVFEFGHTNRTTEFTNLNEHSSRSHALLIVTVRGVDCSTGLRTTGERGRQAARPEHHPPASAPSGAALTCPAPSPQGS